jgi:FAD/FMN-containing dehydrogenase
MAATLVHAPDGSGTKLVALVACHCGALPDGEKALGPVKAFGKPVMDTIGAMPYAEINAMLDGGYPAGALNYWKSSFLASLSDEVLRVMIDSFAACPTAMGQLLVEHFHGAVTRIGPADTAFPHRAPGYNMLVLGQWMDREQSDACIDWTRRSHTALAPFMANGRYVNYFGDDEPSDAVAAAYGPNYRRLQQVKAAYDPENFFRMNQNILPAGPRR